MVIAVSIPIPELSLNAEKLKTRKPMTSTTDVTQRAVPTVENA